MLERQRRSRFGGFGVSDLEILTQIAPKTAVSAVFGANISRSHSL
jgi:hypothetical protein